MYDSGLVAAVSPIAEASPTKENAETITEMCQALTQGLSALTSEDPFTGAKARGAAPPGAPAANQQTVRATTHRVPAAEGAPPRGGWCGVVRGGGGGGGSMFGTMSEC